MAAMERLQAAMRFIGLGWYVGLCIYIGTWGGLWLDRKLGTGPWLVIIGLLFGVFLAFFGLYKMVLAGMNDKHNKGNE
jgi:F0F1-type ATP synthase assembly protein I